MDNLLNIYDIAAYFKCSITKARSIVRRDDFPSAIRPTGGASLWRASQIEEWVAQQ